MKKLRLIYRIPILVLTISFALLIACSSDSNVIQDDTINQSLTEADEVALLFMLEEEKLARDTYNYLDNLWSINQFSNIKKSEQSHMDAISNLLEQNDIAYTILPDGEFENTELQELYNHFKVEGTNSKSLALQIGATIEDLDIVDLKIFTKETTNTAIIEVFNSLECGSRNHLRSFVKAIEINGDAYAPEYLNQDEYNSIISGTNESCK